MDAMNENVTIEPPMRNEKGHWLKGTCPNPAGRPKGDKEMRELARAETKNNLDAMIYLRDNAAGETVRLQAAKILHEIGWGKPKESVDVTTNERVIDALRLGNGTTQGTS